MAFAESKRPRDLHIRYRPRRLEEFWNYPRDRALARLIRGMEMDRLSSLLIFVACFSGGKTTAATYVGQWSSCERWQQQRLPCGECSSCLRVVDGLGDLRCGFYEIDSAKGDPSDAEAAIVAGFNYRFQSIKGDIIDPLTSNPRCRIMFIDEAQRLTGRVQDKLLKPLERIGNGITILATDDIGKIDGGLVSRGTVYLFTPPTPDEAIPHLIRIAAKEGFALAADAAERLAHSCNGIPRDCLGFLQESMNFGVKDITMSEVAEALDE